MSSRRRLAWLLAAAGTWLTVWLALGLRRELIAPRPSTLVQDRHGRYLGEVDGDGEARGYWALPYETPSRLARATIETEDRHFYEHGGVYLPSLARAFWQDLSLRRVVSGASTLAMQVARLQAPGPRNVLRKLRESLEAELLVHAFGHEAVLRQYLTLAPYGNRVHGAARASQLYFGKPVEDLSWLQAAYLAALPQSPGRMNPYDAEGRRRGLARARRILQTLRARSVIDEATLAEALASDLRLVPLPHRPPDALHAALAWGRRAGNAHQNVVAATLDLDIQSQVAGLLAKRLDALAWQGPLNGAALVVDSASGDVLAYVGSRDYFSEDGHGAIDYVETKRSPGSALKPFIYALGLQQGKLTAASLLVDTRLDIQTAGRTAYLPENLNHGFLGPMLAREALANSRNIPALRALSEVGVEPTLQLLEQAGVAGVSMEPDRYGLGLAIGNLPVTLEELVSAYGLLANHGATLPLRWISDAPQRKSKRLLQPPVADLVTQILADPVARRPSFSTGGPLDYPYAVAVKTGTSQGGRDAWAMAYDDRLLVGVWIGSPDWARVDQLTGTSGPAVAVHEILDALTPNYRPYQPLTRTFPFPAGTTTRLVCPLSGKLAGPDCPAGKVEAFIPGTEPVELCPFHSRVRLDRRNGLRAGPACAAADVEVRPMLTLPRELTRWARARRLELAPERDSPRCPLPHADPRPAITIQEPRDNARFVRDPEAPAAEAAIRLEADVDPPDEEIVWIVDGVPIEKVAYPFASRWPLEAGEHVIRAAMVRRSEVSRPVRIFVQR